METKKLYKFYSVNSFGDMSQVYFKARDSQNVASYVLKTIQSYVQNNVQNNVQNGDIEEKEKGRDYFYMIYGIESFIMLRCDERNGKDSVNNYLTNITVEDFMTMINESEVSSGGDVCKVRIEEVKDVIEL